MDNYRIYGTSPYPVRTPEGEEFSFEIDAFRKRCLIESLDGIS